VACQSNIWKGPASKPNRMSRFIPASYSRSLGFKYLLDDGNHDGLFRGCSQSLRAICGIVPQIRLWTLSSSYFAVYYSLITLRTGYSVRK
jgi:hypothetical protein